MTAVHGGYPEDEAQEDLGVDEEIGRGMRTRTHTFAQIRTTLRGLVKAINRQGGVASEVRIP